MVETEHKPKGVKRAHAKPPAGGHRFMHGDVTLKGETVEEVLEKIEAYRAENALALGDPEGDLAAYYEVVAPHLVMEAEKREPSESVRKAEAIMLMWRSHPELQALSDEIVPLRCRVCESCPLRGQMPDLAAAGQYGKLAARRAMLLTSSRICCDRGVCGWTQLPVQLVTLLKDPRQLPGLPEVPKTCWVSEL